MVTTRMKRYRTRKRTFSRAFTLVGAFVLAQLLMQFHGAQYGFTQHSHDGIACQSVIVSEDFDGIEPGGAAIPVPPTAYCLAAFDRIQKTASGIFLVAPTARAPPLPINVI